MSLLNDYKQRHLPPTYVLGLVQARAYRNLERSFKGLLEPFGLTLVEWALVGSLYETSGRRVTELSEIFDVKAPLITSMVDNLTSKDVLERISDPADSRVRIIRLTAKGSELVPRAEQSVRNGLRQIMSGITMRDLLAYQRVLTQLSNDAK